MRFLDHIPTRKVIMEAGIADVGVILDRLIQEIQNLTETYPPMESDEMTDRDYLRDMAADVAAARDKIIADSAGNYARAMWIAKLARGLFIKKISDVLSLQLSAEWVKYSTKVLKNTVNLPAYDTHNHVISRRLAQFYHFVDLARVSAEVARVTWVDPVTKKDKTYEAMAEELPAAEAAWRKALEEKQKNITINDVDKVIITDEQMGLPGWFWVYLQRSKCPEEAKAMGHCGTESGSHLISLRCVTDRDESGKPTEWRPWATASYLPEKKLIGQLKGPHNAKPAIDQPGQSPEVLQRNRTVRKAISYLFNWAELHGFRTSSFRADNDFRPSDLDKEDFDALPDKPGLFATNIASWTRRYGSSPEALMKYYEHSGNPLRQQEFDALDPEMKHQIILNANPNALVYIRFESFWDALGPTPECVERYMETNSKRTIDRNDLNLLDGDSLETAWQLTPASFSLEDFLRMRPGVDQGKAVIEFYERSPLALLQKDLAVMPEELQKHVIQKAPPTALYNIPLGLFVRYLGQTPRMVDKFVASHNVSLKGLLHNFTGKALEHCWKIEPAAFTLQDFLLLVGYQKDGPLNGQGPDLIKELVSTRNRPISKDDFPGLMWMSPADLKKYLQDEDGVVSDYHSPDIYFRAFGLSDETIEQFLSELGPKVQFTGAMAHEDVEDQEINLAIMNYLLKADPAYAAAAVNMRWEPSIGAKGLFVYQTFSDISDCVDYCQDKDRRDNGIDYAIKVSTGERDIDNGHFYWRDAEQALEAVLDYQELKVLPEYVRMNYADSIEEHDLDPDDLSVKEAIEILDAEDDPIVDTAKMAAADGDARGNENALIKTLHDAIVNSKLSVAGFPLDLYFQRKEGWSTELQYDTKCVVGFEPEAFAKLVTKSEDIGAVLYDLYNENYSYEDGFYMDSDRHYSEFDDDAARDYFYGNTPEEFDKLVKQAREKVDAKLKEQRKNRFNESLAERLKW